jgi:uncharacterized repeat protein (TIGR04076 family)
MSVLENYKITFRLISNQKPYNVGHKVGEEWVWENKTPSNMCFAAYNALYPFALVLKYGGQFPWQENPDVMTVSCPDPNVLNQFEIRRIPRKS